MNEFFARLKQRKLVQWAIAYVAAAFALLQGIDIVSQQFGWPEGVRRGITLALVVGFFVTLVLAWYHGERGAQRVSGTELLIIGLVLGLGGGFLWRFAAASHVVDGKSASAPNESRMHEPAPVSSEKSIAVLPFVNLSSDKEQEYFSDGLSEELLNQLAQIPQLRVIARTSSFSFKGKEVDIATIAKALNVANVLEGSVRKSADTLRVTAQLVRASDSSNLWSQTYERRMTDVFKVQDEIAAEVVAALKVKLLPTQLPKTQRTVNAEAYEHYLRGMDLLRRDRLEAARLAAAEFQKAINADQNYANAYVALSIAQAQAADIANSPTQRSAEIKQALATVEKAIALAPDLASGYSCRGFLRFTRAWDWQGAAADFKRALAMDPDNAELLSFYSRSLFFSGRQPEAIAMAHKATVIDPLSVETWHNFGLLLFASGNDSGARVAWQHALDINPETRWPNYLMGYLDLKDGNIESALAHFRATDEPFRLTGTAMVEHTLGHASESEQALETLKMKYTAGSAFQVATVYAWRGEEDRAFEWLDKAYDQHDTGLPRLRYDPTLASLHDDPRFAALVKKMGFSD
jgi:TolB-like protein/Tfp pilus assembly protein PilF